MLVFMGESIKIDERVLRLMFMMLEGLRYVILKLSYDLHVESIVISEPDKMLQLE